MNLTPTDMFAGIALIVSAITAFITWRNHQDSGGRVKVWMNTAAYVPFSGAGKLKRNDKGTFLLEESQEPMVELAQIIIENPGRTGVTVTSVSLRVEGLNRANTTAITPRAFSLTGFGAGDAQSEDYFRLEPYDRRTLLFDYWSVVDAEFDRDPSLRELTIYAEVTVAGHDDPFNSKGHGYWRIHRDFVSAVNGHTVRRPRNIVLTEFLRHSLRNLSRINYMDQFAVTAEDTIHPGWSYSKFEEQLELLLEDPMDLVHLSDQPVFSHMAALEIFQQYQRLGTKAAPFPLLGHRAQHYKARGLTTRTDAKNGE